MNRKYDLDYLQWMQKNARTYMVGLSVLTFFVVVSICMYFEPWQPQSSVAFWNQNDSDQAVAEQQIPEDGAAKVQQQADASIKEETGTAQQRPDESAVKPADKPAVKQENTAENTAAQLQSVDLLQLKNTLPGFTVPCGGNLAYSYGLGYDPIHDDYRFHDALCYQADGAEILAAADGVVQNIDFSSEWQLTLHCGPYQIRYKGLQTCTVGEGDAVIGGQPIGIAGEWLYVKVMQ